MKLIHFCLVHCVIYVRMLSANSLPEDPKKGSKRSWICFVSLGDLKVCFSFANNISASLSNMLCGKLTLRRVSTCERGGGGDSDWFIKRKVKSSASLALPLSLVFQDPDIFPGYPLSRPFTTVSSASFHLGQSSQKKSYKGHGEWVLVRESSGAWAELLFHPLFLLCRD